MNQDLVKHEESISTTWKCPISNTTCDRGNETKLTQANQGLVGVESGFRPERAGRVHTGIVAATSKEQNLTDPKMVTESKRPKALWTIKQPNITWHSESVKSWISFRYIHKLLNPEIGHHQKVQDQIYSHLLPSSPRRLEWFNGFRNECMRDLQLQGK